MKTKVFLLLISILSSSLGTQARRADYKLWLQGICLSLGLNCPIEELDVCYTDAAPEFHINWHANRGASILGRGLIGKTIREFYSDSGSQYIYSIIEIISHCDKDHKIGSLIRDSGYNIWDPDILDKVQSTFMKDRPEFYRHFLSDIKEFLNKGEYEAAGIVMGDFIKAIFEYGSDRVPKLEMSHYLHGLCQALDLQCPMDSLECWSDGAVEGFFRIHFKLLEAISNSENNEIADVLDLFKWGDYRLFSELISNEILKCDELSKDKWMIREKLGFFEFGDEAFWAIKKFSENNPEVLKAFSKKLLKLLKERQLNEYGQVLGLQFLMISNNLNLLKSEPMKPKVELKEEKSIEYSIDISDF